MTAAVTAQPQGPDRRALEAIQRARFDAAIDLPYFGAALWAASFVETREVPTMGIDRYWRIHYNPDFVLQKDKTPGHLPFVLWHEVCHQLLKHLPRATALGVTEENHDAANTFEDWEINFRLSECTTRSGRRVEVPPDATMAAQHKQPPGLTFEEYWHRAPKQKKPCPSCAGGSGATGIRQPWEAPPLSGSGDKDEQPGLTEAEAELVRRAVAHSIQKHAEKKGRGSVPAALLVWAEQIAAPPAIDWRMLLAGSVRKSLEARRGWVPSYARPARRRIPGGLVLPVYRSPVSRVGVVLDTSGSMGGRPLGRAITEVAHATFAAGTVLAVACDAQAYEPREVQDVNELREVLQGGGGTDMSPGIASAVEAGCDAIVVITDGDTPWPDESPEVPITVLLVAGPRRDVPTWAQVVVADDLDEEE